MLSIDVVRESGLDGLVVMIGGEIDMLTADAVAAVVQKLLHSSKPTVVLDFTAVTFLDSSAIAVLVDLRRTQHAITGSALYLRNMSHRQIRLLQLTHTRELFTWLPDSAKSAAAD